MWKGHCRSNPLTISIVSGRQVRMQVHVGPGGQWRRSHCESSRPVKIPVTFGRVYASRNVRLPRLGEVLCNVWERSVPRAKCGTRACSTRTAAKIARSDHSRPACISASVRFKWAPVAVYWTRKGYERVGTMSLAVKMTYNIDWIIPSLRTPSKLWNLVSAVTVFTVGLFSKIFIGSFVFRLTFFTIQHSYLPRTKFIFIFTAAIS